LVSIKEVSVYFFQIAQAESVMVLPFPNGNDRMIGDVVDKIDFFALCTNRKFRLGGI